MEKGAFLCAHIIFMQIDVCSANKFMPKLLHSLFDRCASTGKAIPKDKAIKRFIVRNIVDASSLRDIKEASAYQEYQLPKLYLKMYYCVEAAVHQRIVRGRSREARRIRTPPERKFVRKN